MSEGEVTPAMMRERLDAAGVVLRGAGLDESPHCYKQIEDVIAAHKETTIIQHTLTPMGVAMAGADTFDPFRD